MISHDQRKLYWANLHAVMGSTPVSGVPSGVSPEAFRAEFHAQHNLPPSTKDFTKKHFDTFLAACAAITQPANLKPQLRALHQEKTRLLHKILVVQAALLKALDIAAPGEYIAQICAGKFRGRKPADLSASPRPQGEGAQRAGDGPDKKQYSELEKLLFTVANRIKDLRQEKGWTVHDLNIAAGLPCACASCSRRRSPSPSGRGTKGEGPAAPRGPLVEADNVPF